MFRLKLLILSLILFWITFSIFAIISISPFSPILPEYKTKYFIKSIFPEGWGFFTRNPREHMLYVYKNVNKNWVLETLPNFYYAYGIGRDMRVQGAEVSKILKELKPNDWKETTVLDSCFRYRKTIGVSNNSSIPNICGNYILVLQEPVPWAWSTDKSKITMPIKFVKLKIICKR